MPTLCAGQPDRKRRHARPARGNSGNSETGKPHIVYLSPQALALFAELRSLAGGSELVLPGRRSLTRPFAHNAMSNALKVALRGQDTPAFTIHDLRRTASTLLQSTDGRRMWRRRR